MYGGVEELLEKGYKYASFMTDHDDFKSQSGYVFTLNDGAVSWKSFKQNTVADSTTKAEYIACDALKIKPCTGIIHAGYTTEIKDSR